MKRVLVTGANGFIGRHCLPLLLKEGVEVHATDIFPPVDKSSAIRWHCTDLLDSEQLDTLVAEVKPSHLLHFSWYAVPGKYWEAIENVRWVEASLRLMQAFHLHGGRRMVFAGTCAEYDWNYGYCIEETTPLSPGSLYGVCKYALYRIVREFSKQKGFSTAWGRVFFLYGPHEHPSRLVAYVIKSLLDNQKALCSHGNQIRDFLHVHDVARAFVDILNSDVSGAVNIASGIPITLKEVIFKIGDILGARNLIQMGKVPTNDDESPVIFANNRRLAHEAGWSPMFDIDSGLENAIGWWKNNITHSNRT